MILHTYLTVLDVNLLLIQHHCLVAYKSTDITLY